MAKSRWYYPESFYSTSWQRASQSARRVVPVVLHFAEARSVVDVGCGTAAWLEVIREKGIDDVLGVDGDYVNRKLLRIPEHLFHVHDLVTPLRLPRRFDLAISLEVAEHIAPSHAERFVDDLTRLAPVIIFSAAIPAQGGTHHVNEQWPEYWAELFQKKEYVVIDCIRPLIWSDSQVEFFYAQNILLFAAESHLHRYPLLEAEASRRRADPLARVHPRAWLHAHDPGRQRLSFLLHGLWQRCASLATWRNKKTDR
jgi:SAM-dependent methyltransferase